MLYCTARVLSVTTVNTTEGSTTTTAVVFINGDHEGCTWNYVGPDVQPGALVNVKFHPDDQFCYSDGTPITVPVRLKTLGFEHEMTGGNCTAYVRRADGKETMITLADDHGEAEQEAPSKFSDKVYVGTYHEGTCDVVPGTTFVGRLDLYLSKLVNGV